MAQETSKSWPITDPIGPSVVVSVPGRLGGWLRLAPTTPVVVWCLDPTAGGGGGVRRVFPGPSSNSLVRDPRESVSSNDKASRTRLGEPRRCLSRLTACTRKDSMMRGAAWLVWVLLLFGCTDPTPPSAESLPTQAYPLGLQVTEALASPAMTPALSCDPAEGGTFPESVLQEPGLSSDEFLITREGKAVQEKLTSMGVNDSEGLSTADRYYILRPGFLAGVVSKDELVSVYSFKSTDDSLEVINRGGCNPRRVRGRFYAATWDAVSDGTTNSGQRISLSVEGGYCAGAKEETITVIEDIEVNETLRTVSILVWAHDPVIEATCGSIGTEIPLEVQLDQPLGDRRLLDIGEEPPRQISTS